MEFDYVIVGSGFGGSVAAHRLSEQGHSVAVLERGFRYGAQDFPKTNWNLKKYLWSPILRCFGIQNITLFKNVFVLSGSGVGGGSLVYANTLMTPGPQAFSNHWPKSTDWYAELQPAYKKAKQMLGVVTNPKLTSSDELLRQVGADLGCENTFHPVEVGVYFGQSDQEVPDPYFAGQGPKRSGCNFCGGCMVGCRFNAKNTLDKNYLYLAEQNGSKIFPGQTVTRINPSGGGYEVYTEATKSIIFRSRKIFRAKKVILAAGVLGTNKILMANKYKFKTLKNLSDQLGQRVRTNGESIVGSTAKTQGEDHSHGLAISSSIHPDNKTKIELVRYPKGSNFMKLLSVPLTPEAPAALRPFLLALVCLKNLPSLLALWCSKNWATRTIILLAMQTVENKMRFSYKRRWWRLFFWSFNTEVGPHRVPAFIPVADQATRHLAKRMDGIAQNAFSEPLLNIPATAHILGGACLANTEAEGVVNSDFEVFGYPGLFVMDGSVVPSNLGVNPSLTITALAEYAIQKHLLSPTQHIGGNGMSAGKGKKL